MQADGGTRCASITGGFIALRLAVNSLLEKKIIKKDPILSRICAISCGIYKNQVMIDLDYEEDSACQADVNFVVNDIGKIIEIQGTAEGNPFTFSQLSEMYDLVRSACKEIFLKIN